MTLFLPIIFMLHNIEEYVSYAQFSKYYSRFIKKEFNDSTVFLYAISLLSAIAFIIVAANYFFNNDILHYLMIIMLISISINAIQHCISSLYFKTILPGTISSITLIIPYATLLSINLYKQHYPKIEWILYITIISFIFMYLLLFMSLYIGYWIKLKLQQQ